MAKHWDTANAPSSKHGLMVCPTCNRSITEGEYRVRDAGEAYVTQHRACSSEWEGWSLLDRQRAKSQRAAKQEAIAALLAQAEADGITRDELRSALAAGVPPVSQASDGIRNEGVK